MKVNSPASAHVDKSGLLSTKSQRGIVGATSLNHGSCPFAPTSLSRIARPKKVRGGSTPGTNGGATRIEAANTPPVRNRKPGSALSSPREESISTVFGHASGGPMQLGLSAIKALSQRVSPPPSISPPSAPTSSRSHAGAITSKTTTTLTMFFMRHPTLSLPCATRSHR